MKHWNTEGYIPKLQIDQWISIGLFTLILSVRIVKRCVECTICKDVAHVDSK